MNRRDFLGTSAAVFAAMNAGSSVWAKPTQAETSGLQLGLVSYNWGKDWDLPTLIENCAATGFKGAELRTEHRHGVEVTLNQAQRAEVRKRFADSPVTFVGSGSTCEYHSPDPEVLKKNIESTKEFILLSHDCGGTGVKVRPNDLPKDVPEEKTIEQIGLALREVAKFAAEHGQEIRLEVHGRKTDEPKVVHQIMQIADHPQARLCWNCNPTDLKGEGLDANFRLCADKIATVHIHDLRSNSYPWPELFELLTAHHFNGWLLLEEGKVPEDPVAAMHENKKRFQELVAQAK
ncbi:TIM barrel protein [Planctomicrobium sp. SH661]|uniref:sugar phosphate isomerase/epimerase family protein n=1 Tax=Planctomicrobium sp. SH661 TaxID=3448124 RepID=UPI003F5C3BEA